MPKSITTSEELRSAFDLLMEHIPPEDIAVYSLRHSPKTVYTTLTTLLILTLQRLGGGQSLQQVVRDVVGEHSYLFPDNKRVREKRLSTNPSAFSKARLKLSVKETERFCDSVANSIIASHNAPLLQERAIYVVDGTTIALSPTSELTEVYPPAINQFGQSVWPIMMITLAHELHSGAALRPEFGAKYGKDNTSEAEQIESLAKRIPQNSLLLADSGYGIFRVCYRCRREAQQEILFRLTNARFKSMKRYAELISSDDGIEHYELNWTPSSKDRTSNPELPCDANLLVQIYSCDLPSGEQLHLVSSISFSPHTAVDIYGLRYTAIEHDIRDIKTTLNLEKMCAQNEAMVQKEILCSMVAYNLVVQFRRAAAKRANVPPRRISFKRSYETLEIYLLRFGAQPLEKWIERYEEAVAIVSKDKHPLRPGRSFPRKAYPKRPKSTNAQRHKKARNQEDLLPPDPTSG